MIAPKKFPQELERLKDLESYNILDTLSEVDYDNLTAIAAEICGTPISLISLIDSKRQWFKSHHGLGASETPKEFAFCAHAINDPDNVFIVQDARLDKRFFDNPLVVDDPNVIFYAGVPLISEAGLPLGTLCVIDNVPKALSPKQIQSLSALADQVINLLTLRKKKIILEEALEKLEEKNKELQRFAVIAAHDLKSPLIGISSLLKVFSEKYQSKIDLSGLKILKSIESSSDKLKNLIDGLLNYSRSENLLKEKKSIINLNLLVDNISALFNYESNLVIELKTNLDDVYINRTAIEQILINLITNSIKYNDKENVQIEIGVSELKNCYQFYVKDNGQGIDLEYQNKIFEIFEIFSSKDKFGKKGNGIGLATVKKIIEKSGGTIKVESEIGKGSKFIFTLEKQELEAFQSA